MWPCTVTFLNNWNCVLGHYLPTSLSAFRNYVNFIQNYFTMSKSHCKKIFDLAAVVSKSSRRIFMAKDCQEWCVDTWIIYFYCNCVCVFLSVVSLPCPPVGSVLPYFVVACVRGFIVIVFITNNNDGFSLLAIMLAIKRK